MASTQNLSHNAGWGHAGETFFQAGAFKEQLLKVQAELVQNRRVEVMHADRALDDGVSEVIGRSVSRTALDAAAGHP